MDIPVPSSAGTLTTDASQLSSFHRYCLALRCHLTFVSIHLWDVFLRDSRYRTMPSHFASIQHWRAKKVPELSLESVVTLILPLPLPRPVPPVSQGMASRAPLQNSQSTWDPTNSCNYKTHICKYPHQCCLLSLLRIHAPTAVKTSFSRMNHNKLKDPIMVQLSTKCTAPAQIS